MNIDARFAKKEDQIDRPKSLNDSSFSNVTVHYTILLLW